ncbi:hypothetical protein B0H67DRAFT_100002 [Lasiosphaeris hirsuta]|uniref:Lipid droplet-associated hydrolase n=1 Tax=Lasiosphaeris hirsuta TaxID=260670 RepID=A0AA40E4X9_9PEZI|nr:hypothetical protein B0H67DRAFT_100002 [Lasiosphaeris hirsuta]
MTPKTAPSQATDVLIHDLGSNDGRAEKFMIYILPGNPGLISFYEPFAIALALLLQRSSVAKNASIRICGKSLRGFETGATGATDRNEQTTGPVSLAETILRTEADLMALATSTSTPSAVSASPVRIILVGHSVGAYILLELLRRHRCGAGANVHNPVDIVGGILVFPTVTHIARSRAGWILTPLLSIWGFAAIVGVLVNIVFFLLPFSFVYWLVRIVARFPASAATTVTHFLKSRHGVRQTCWLGKEEMRLITEDKWNEDVWGNGSPQDPTLYMYFGQNDPFVPNDARDKLIVAHGNIPGQETSQESRAFIDIYKIPHSWCIEHSDTIAEKVTPWVEKIISRYPQ